MPLGKNISKYFIFLIIFFLFFAVQPVLAVVGCCKTTNSSTQGESITCENTQNLSTCVSPPFRTGQQYSIKKDPFANKTCNEIPGCPTIDLAAGGGCCKMTTLSAGKESVTCEDSPDLSGCVSATYDRYSVNREPITGTACIDVEGCSQNIKTQAPAAQIDTSKLTPLVQVEIGDTVIQFDPVQCSPGTDCSIPWLAQYIKVIYQYLVGLAAIIAAVVFLFGGFIWLTSFGSPEKVNKAKEYMTGAFTGLFLALFSYLILFTINPELVNLKPIVIRIVSPLLAELGEQKLGDPKPSATGAKPQTAGQCREPRAAGTSVPAQITSYCKPQRSDREYRSDDEFYCDLAMQCTCPAGRDQSKVCNPGRREWHPCNPFDYQNTPYCNQTASGQPPGTGLVAADLSCYPMGSKVCIEGSTYEVGDIGGWIDGDHFDLWNEDCDVARGVNRTVTASAGACP
jgi:3D (Asp-Asp-Asp) domain-containing protein